MTLRRALLFGTLALNVVALHLGCADNGDADDRPVGDAGRVDAGSSTSEPAPRDAEVASDARLDAKTDAAADAEAGPPPPSSALMRIQEVYVDHDGLGDGSEYVELRGAPGTPVDDLTLRVLDGNGSVYADVAVGDPGDVVGATGTWVVAGGTIFNVAATNRVDQTLSISSWGLPNARGAIQLLRGPSRDLVDVLGYATTADAGAPSAPATPPTATSEALFVVVPSVAKRALGRLSGAPDTNDNRADFCAMTATPGAASQASACN